MKNDTPVLTVSIVKPIARITNHLAEPVITSVIQNRLSNVSALRLTAILVRRAQLKVNDLLMNRTMVHV
jgi:hypothetical protein